MKMVKRPYSRLSGGSYRHEWSPGCRSSRQGQKAVEYVRICSLYGAGFFYIPGTDTCIKLGGYLRVDTTFNGSIYDQPAGGRAISARANRYRDYFAARSRLALTIDNPHPRRNTALSAPSVRLTSSSVPQGNNTVNPANFTASPSGRHQYRPAVPARRRATSPSSTCSSSFAGFTFGKSSSGPNATPWNGIIRATTPRSCSAVMTPSPA